MVEGSLVGAVQGSGMAECCILRHCCTRPYTEGLCILRFVSGTHRHMIVYTGSSWTDIHLQTKYGKQ